MTDKGKSEDQAGAIGTRIGFGNRPALLVIDFMKAYTSEDAPLYSPGVVDAVKESPELIEAARSAGITIIHTNVRYNPDTFEDGGVWIRKLPVLKCLVEGNPHADTCDEVLPAPGEIVITKNYASAFFGTSLSATLTAKGIDTVILIGCSTSGCIRATAVDAVQNGFRTIVVRECVGDRHPEPHEANLFDINSKYGDVITKGEAFDYLKRHSVQ